MTLLYCCSIVFLTLLSYSSSSDPPFLKPNQASKKAALYNLVTQCSTASS